MQLHLHQTHHLIGDFQEIFSYLEQSFTKKTPDDGLHIFCELFLTGYPLQDLCLKKSFIKNYLDYFNRLDQALKSLPTNRNWTALVGGLNYEFDEDGNLFKITNDIFQLNSGKGISSVYSKKLLPNYDIFDEQKYFSPGESVGLINWNDKNIGLLICEDMWHSSMHKTDPVKELLEHIEKNSFKLDLVVNLSASPFHLNKKSKREKRAKHISNVLSAPFCYVNRVGGEDEVIFDGGSFVVERDSIPTYGPFYKAEIISHTLNNSSISSQKINQNLNQGENTWESLYSPQIEKSQTRGHPLIPKLSDQRAQEVIEATIFGIREYANKTGFKKFLVALSGGIDSSLVCALSKMALQNNQTIEAIFMPSIYTSSLSFELSEKLCQNLSIQLHTMPIKFIHSTIKNAFQDNFNQNLEGIADENIQSRLRGNLLYARSNQTNALVINTSNKSELAVGYSTLYGDSVGAISPLGDLYKSEVYDLARELNKRSGYDIIPDQIITRPPSAELRMDQEDAQSLPPYERLDPLLECILANGHSVDEIVEMGFSEDETRRIYKLYELSEYKRKQFCPILKMKPKSFGFGHRVPICRNLTS